MPLTSFEASSSRVERGSSNYEHNQPNWDHESVPSRPVDQWPPPQPTASETKEAEKLEGLITGARDGNKDASAALQRELISLEKDPQQWQGINNQFKLDQAADAHLPDFTLTNDMGFGLTATAWNPARSEPGNFSENSSGGIYAQDASSYPPNQTDAFGQKDFYANSIYESQKAAFEKTLAQVVPAHGPRDKNDMSHVEIEHPRPQ